MVAQLGIGFAVSRRVKTEDDYLVAGRSLGPVLLTFTVFATWFGAESMVGAAGAVHARGLSGGSADPFGYGICILIMGFAFAIPMWRLRLTTLADFFRLRFGVATERLVVFLLLPSSVLWAAAQIRAFGQVLASASGTAVDVAIGIAALVVILYTIVGGLLADAWTDLVQGSVLVVGLVVLAAKVLGDGGLAALSSLPPGALNPLDGDGLSALAVAEEWAIPVIGGLVTTELIARIIAARSGQVARNGTVLAGFLYLAVGVIPVVLGLVGSVLIPDLDQAEQVLPALAEIYLPELLYVVFVGALVSAILSTVDSALLVAAGLVSHNVILSLRPGLSERAKVIIARVGVAAFGILAFFIAGRAETVYDLVEEASAFGSAGFVVVVSLGLFSVFGRQWTALATLIMGEISWIAAAYVIPVPYPFLTSCAAALATYAVGAALEGGISERLRINPAYREPPPS